MGDLTEIEQRILSELEEAGEESIQTIVVTVLDGIGNASEIELLKHSLGRLVSDDLIRIANDRDTSRRLRALPIDASLREIAAIGAFLAFDANKMRWLDKRRVRPPFGPEFPFVVATEQGKKIGFEILDRRGYQWWRPKQ